MKYNDHVDETSIKLEMVKVKGVCIMLLTTSGLKGLLTKLTW